MTNFDGYTESQAQTNARAWNIAMQSVGYMRDFRPLNTEAEADAIYAFIQAAEAGDKKTDFNTHKRIRIIVSQSWKDEAEALAADARDYADQVSELLGGG